MKPMHFSPEQLAWLAEAFTAPCCHTSGMHDPTHYEKNPAELCRSQQAKAYERGMVALGLTQIAKPEPGCYWCKRQTERAHGA